ncbi:TLR2 [Mytilus coruscus]|uniref:TLR2 n=1 Tax=Mytilus coruscus TaxID=42192 RepID=A0A6J8DZ69_MYTCO|nr:TLR2 [Mytilus coruscus]
MVNKDVCLLEQGYALVHDMSANIENIASIKLNDEHKLLQAEHHRREKERKIVLQKCVFHNKQTLENNPTDFEFFQDESFVKYIKDPMIPLKKAYDMQKCMPDSFVMNKYGRALFHLSKETDSREKRQRLEKDEEILTKSTECFTMNWFAYSTRMQVAESLGDFHLTTNRGLSWQYFQGALSDGNQCFESKGSAIDMEILARICQKIAKFPSTNKYGAHVVKNKELINYALDYLQHGIALSGPSKYNIAKRTASCLYDLDKIVTAAEWMKRALFYVHMLRYMTTGLDIITEILQCDTAISKLDTGRQKQFEQFKEQISSVVPQDDIDRSVRTIFSTYPDLSRDSTEKKFSDEEEAFKGCIADRDFVPGKTIMKNITEAIRKSCKIILALTRNFVASPWCENETERALVRDINDKDSCVIPLLLEPLSDELFPDCLKNITYLDMTDESTRIQEISRLKRALLYVCCMVSKIHLISITTLKLYGINNVVEHL